MATQSAPNAEPTELALRDRIHRIFCADTSPAESAGSPPSFWVQPSDEQKGNVVLDLHDTVVLAEEFHITINKVDLASEERRWLNEPHVDLDGQSPEEMLNGDEHSRERLETFLTAVETAIRGSFS